MESENDTGTENSTQITPIEQTLPQSNETISNPESRLEETGSEENGNPDLDSNTFIIIGVAVAVVVVLLVAVAIIVVRKKRQNGGKYNPADNENRAGVGINKQNIDIANIIDTPEPERLI
jgi:hypothetical protein